VWSSSEPPQPCRRPVTSHPFCPCPVARACGLPAANRAAPAWQRLAAGALVSVARGAQGVPGQGVRQGGRREAGGQIRVRAPHEGDKVARSAHAGGGKGRLNFLYTEEGEFCAIVSPSVSEAAAGGNAWDNTSGIRLRHSHLWMSSAPRAPCPLSELAWETSCIYSNLSPVCRGPVTRPWSQGKDQKHIPKSDLARIGLRQGQGKIDLLVIDPPHSLLMLAVIFAPNAAATNPLTIPATSVRYATRDKRV
jgi:hypothetical protein